MSFALIQSALLLPLELTLNQVLALDPASRSRLSAMSGSTLAVQVQQPNVTLFVSVHTDRLRLSPRFEGDVTTTLIGSASALAGLLLRREPLTNLQGRKLELRGDVRFAQALQNLLLDLQIDWEFQLSRLIGDIPTQAMADTAHTAQNYVKTASSRMRDEVQDFLQQESGLLPGHAEMNAFYDGVQALVLRTDRLDARLRLQEQRKG